MQEGLRYYLCTSRMMQRHPVRGRVEIVEAFCAGLETRLNNISVGEEDVPMKRPLQYIGYAVHWPTRWKSHDSGETAFLLQLVRSALQVLYPGVIAMNGFPLCFFVHDGEVRLGELLLPMLADSFSATGGGFNAYPPGMNNSSADAVDSSVWERCKEFRVEMGCWNENSIAESAILERGGMQASELPSEAFPDGTQQAKSAGLQAKRQGLIARLEKLRLEKEQGLQNDIRVVDATLEKEAVQGVVAVRDWTWGNKAQMEKYLP
jgi:hypothetical protein